MYNIRYGLFYDNHTHMENPDVGKDFDAEYFTDQLLRSLLGKINRKEINVQSGIEFHFRRFFFCKPIGRQPKKLDKFTIKP